MAIDLYLITLSPPSRAVLMAAKHLNIPLNLKVLNLRQHEHFKPEFERINPVRKVPAIVDKGFVLWESRAIMQYFCNKYAPNSPLYPTDVHKRAIVDRMLNFDCSSYYVTVREGLLIKVIRDLEPTELQITNYKNNLKLMDTLIGDNKYVAGSELTIADLSVLATTTVLAINDYKDIKDLPKLKTWFERMQKELPYYEEINGDVQDQFKQIIADKPFYRS